MSVRATTELYDPIASSDDPSELKQKSRDFYWFSPILNESMENLRADLVLYPADQDELARAVQLSVQKRISLTARGGGTGNYGQCVPLNGGVVVDFAKMNRVLSIEGWKARAQAGIILADFNKALNEHGKELRLYPSTVRTASLGGFIGGGNGGVGSATWGVTRQPGNVLSARIMTVEETPRVLELRGDDLKMVHHAYGTTGLILDVELPLAPAYAWVDLMYDFADFGQAMAFCKAVAHENGIVARDIATVQWPAPLAFKKIQPYIVDGRHIAFASVADLSLEALDVVAARLGARERYRKTAADLELERLTPNYEYCWNHATLYSLLSDRNRPVTYLQCGFERGSEIETVAALQASLSPEVLVSLQWVRVYGQVTCFGLHLVQFTGRDRLYELMDIHRGLGISLRDPHVSDCEHGEPEPIHAEMAEFKRQTDPFGLLNPGKLGSAFPGLP